VLPAGTLLNRDSAAVASTTNCNHTSELRRASFSYHLLFSVVYLFSVGGVGIAGQLASAERFC
jgi:hypothetical protein